MIAQLADIYTSESYFGKPAGRDRGVELVICVRGGSLGGRGPNRRVFGHVDITLRAFPV